MAQRVKINNLLTLLAAALLLAAACGRAVADSAMPGDTPPEGAIRLLYFSSHPDVTVPEAAERFAAVASAARAAKEAHRDSYLLLGGSFLGPSVLGSVDQGRHIIEILNELSPALMAVGKREFAYGTRRMIESAAQASFPFLSSNTVLTGEMNHLVHKSYMLRTPSMNIGFLALTSPDALTEYGASEVTTMDVNTIVTARASALRQQGADVIILFADIDFPDLRYLERRQVLDIVFYAHNTDNPFTLDAQGNVQTEGPRDGKLIILDLWGEDFGIGGLNLQSRAQIVDLSAFAPDTAMTALIAAERDKLDRLLAEKIGTVGGAFDTHLTNVRTGENGFGNLLADSLRQAMETDVALVNGGAIRGNKAYGSGDTLSRSDIQRELPFATYSVAIQLTGAQLLAALEQSISCALAADGCFLHMSNITVTYDSRRPEGLRIERVEVGGVMLERGATYSVAVSDFLARGNDRYAKFAGAERLQRSSSGRIFWDILVEHIARTETVTAAIDGRFVDIAHQGSSNQGNE